MTYPRDSRRKGRAPARCVRYVRTQGAINSAPPRRGSRCTCKCAQVQAYRFARIHPRLTHIAPIHAHSLRLSLSRAASPSYRDDRIARSRREECASSRRSEMRVWTNHVRLPTATQCVLDLPRLHRKRRGVTYKCIRAPWRSKCLLRWDRPYRRPYRSCFLSKLRQERILSRGSRRWTLPMDQTRRGVQSVRAESALGALARARALARLGVRCSRGRQLGTRRDSSKISLPSSPSVATSHPPFSNGVAVPVPRAVDEPEFIGHPPGSLSRSRTCLARFPYSEYALCWSDPSSRRSEERSATRLQFTRAFVCRR